MLFLLFSISALILSVISSIDISLSSKDDTDIFKFVISIFKLSIYVWSSLFNLTNSSTSKFKVCISFSRFAKSSINFSLFSAISFFWLFRFSISCFVLSILIVNLSTFSEINSTFCFCVAYSISISCKLLSKCSIVSNNSSMLSKYSSFSFSLFFNFEFNLFNSSFKSSISLLLPRIFTVLVCTEPPVIAPEELIISPFNVTTLNA